MQRPGGLSRNRLSSFLPVTSSDHSLGLQRAQKPPGSAPCCPSHHAAPKDGPAVLYPTSMESWVFTLPASQGADSRAKEGWARDGSKIVTLPCPACSGDCLGSSPDSSPFTSGSLTLGKLGNFSQPQLPHLCNGYNRGAHFRESLNKAMVTEFLLLLLMMR